MASEIWGCWVASAHSPACFNEAEARWPRKSALGASLKPPLKCFNEAEARWPRKWSGLPYPLCSPQSASMRPRRDGLGNFARHDVVIDHQAASMRPRRDGLGNALKAVRQTSGAGSSFNEAEARWPRKCRWQRHDHHPTHSFNEAEARWPRKF